MNGFSTLSALIVVPAIAAVVVMLIPERRRELVRPLGVILSLLPVPLAVLLFVEFERGVAGFQFVERVVWIRQLA